MILTTSASKVIRLLLALDVRAFPAAGNRTGQTTQEKQEVWIDNKNKARTTLGGSFGSPSSFRLSNPRLPPFYTPSPYTMLESAVIMRSSFRMQLKNLAKANCF